MSALFSIFSNRQAPQPTFVNAFPSKPTEVYVTQDTTTRVDPPPAQPRLSFTSKLRRGSRASAAKRQSNGNVPDTPRAPSAFRTTFMLLSPRRGSVSAAASQWPKDKGAYDYDSSPPGTTFPPSVLSPRRGSVSAAASQWPKDKGAPDYDFSPPGTTFPPPMERVVYIDREPRILTRTFFFLGILFPIFWIIGAVALLKPMSSDMPDLEQSQPPNGTIARKVSSSVRDTEIRWARFCLAALVIEIFFVLLIVITATWGMKLFTKQPA